MGDLKIIRHPLDRFSFSGNMRDLDAAGRDSADQRLTMIGDMRFLKGTVRGTCARYFLLIDVSWFPKLCFSAHINCETLRAYLWRCESGQKDEIENTSDDAQTALPFPEVKGQAAATLNRALETEFESRSTHDLRAGTRTGYPEASADGNLVIGCCTPTTCKIPRKAKQEGPPGLKRGAPRGHTQVRSAAY